MHYLAISIQTNIYDIYIPVQFCAKHSVVAPLKSPQEKHKEDVELSESSISVCACLCVCVSPP